MTPSEFFKARLDELEVVALAAKATVDDDGLWHAHYADYEGSWIVSGPVNPKMCCAHRDEGEEWHPLVNAMTPAFVLADVAAKRQILALHEQWVVMISTPPEVQRPDDALDFSRYVIRMRQQIDFATREEYRRRFGDEPPTAPFIMALIQPYHEHPEFDPAWRQV